MSKDKRQSAVQNLNDFRDDTPCHPFFKWCFEKRVHWVHWANWRVRTPTMWLARLTVWLWVVAIATTPATVDGGGDKLDEVRL